MVEVKMIESKLKGIMGLMSNYGYDGIREDLENKVKDEKCKIHKSESFGTIFINAEKKGAIEFGEFCCEKFKKEFTG